MSISKKNGGLKMQYTIDKKTSIYNKNLKYRLLGVFDNGGKHIEYFKTKKQAEYKKNWYEVKCQEKYRGVK